MTITNVRSIDCAPGIRVGHARRAVPTVARPAEIHRRPATGARLAAGLATLALACGGSASGDPAGEAPAAPAAAEPLASPGPTPAPDPAPALRLTAISADRLRGHLTWLADDDRRGRATPSPELDAAADYVAAEFGRLDLVAPDAAPGYQQRFDCGGDLHPGLASNVMGGLRGRDPELASQWVIVSAHYDHLGERPGGGEDTIYNGANDNASGTAAMLTLAAALAAEPPRRSVLFIAFCGEERGLLGSRYYAEHPARPLADTVAAVNLEMLGRPAPEGTPTAWITGMGRSDLGTWLNAPNDPQRMRFVDGLEIGPEEGNAFERSDNFPLAQHGVIAHTIAAGRIDASYHSIDDEADGIDYARMAEIVLGIARGVHALAERDGRPVWLDPPG